MRHAGQRPSRLRMDNPHTADEGSGVAPLKQDMVAPRIFGIHLSLFSPKRFISQLRAIYKIPKFLTYCDFLIVCNFDFVRKINFIW